MLPSNTPVEGRGFHALLKNRSFMMLWSGQVLSQVADKVLFILLIALLVDYRTPAAWKNSMRSVLMIAVTLPAILFGSAAGIVVDRFDKRQILWSINIIRGLLLLAIPVLPKHVLILLAVGFLESILTQFFAPAEQAAIPLLVRRENLMSANALFTTTLLGSLIVGFAVGEPLLTLASTWGGDYGREFLVGGLYLLAGGVLFLIPVRETDLVNPLVGIHPWEDFKEGLRYLRGNRLVSNAMVQLTILYSVFAALTVLAIDLASEIGLKATQFGFLLAAAGVGMIFGAAILGNYGERLRGKPLPLVGFLSMAFVLGAFTFIDTLWLGLVLSAVLGLGASMVGVPMQTLIQQQTPEAMRGKVFGFQNNVVNIALSLPLALTGPLTDRFGLRPVLLAMSMIVSMAAIWAWHNTRDVLKDVI